MLTTCWRSWSTVSPIVGEEGRPLPADRSEKRKSVGRGGSQILHVDLAVSNLDQIDIREALPAFRTGRTRLFEDDVAVETLHIDLPECVLDCRGFSLACLLDRRCDSADAVIAAEAFRAAREVEAALLPFADEVGG